MFKQKDITGLKKNPIPLWVKEEADSLGLRLQQYVLDSVVILQDEGARQRVKNQLLREGFRVIIGR